MYPPTRDEGRQGGPALRPLAVAGDAATVTSIPLDLPCPPPFPPLRLDQLELDDDMREVPLPFIQRALLEMGPLMLQGTLGTTVLDALDSTEPPLPSLACTPAPDLPHPTCLLDIFFVDTQEHHLVPAHGLAWALASSRLSALSKSHSHLDGEHLLLPVHPLHLPSQPTFHLIEHYIYTRSHAQLLNDLLGNPSSPSSPPSASSSSATSPSPASVPPSPPPPLEGERGAPQHATNGLGEPFRYPLERVQRIQQLWQNAVALELADAAFWDTLRRAWSVLVADLREAQAQ